MYVTMQFISIDNVMAGVMITKSAQHDSNCFVSGSRTPKQILILLFFDSYEKNLFHENSCYLKSWF